MMATWAVKAKWSVVKMSDSENISVALRQYALGAFYRIGLDAFHLIICRMWSNEGKE